MDNLGQVVADIKEKGYSRIPNFLTKSQALHIEKYMEGFNAINYNKENLLNRLCYKREESHNRQGDAYMVSLYQGELPSIQMKDAIMEEAMAFYNAVVGEMVGKVMKPSTRCMLNCQKYFDKSLPVWDHYDGEFFDFEHGSNKYEDKSLIINRGLLPRYVMVLVLYNENDKGTYIRPHDSEERIDIPNEAYDMIIFDNIAMRHGVPELEHPRMMIGFRNFDYYPYLFEAYPEAGNRWIELQDEVNPGWIGDIDEDTSIYVQKQFRKEWAEKAEKILEGDAAF